MTPAPALVPLMPAFNGMGEPVTKVTYREGVGVIIQTQPIPFKRLTRKQLAELPCPFCARPLDVGGVAEDAATGDSYVWDSMLGQARHAHPSCIARVLGGGGFVRKLREVRSIRCGRCGGLLWCDHTLGGATSRVICGDGGDFVDLEPGQIPPPPAPFTLEVIRGTTEMPKSPSWKTL